MVGHFWLHGQEAGLQNPRSHVFVKWWNFEYIYPELTFYVYLTYINNITTEAF